MERRWVPTKENLADDGTRVPHGALKNNSRWFLGPPFFKKSENHWPIEKFHEKYVELTSVLLTKSTN